MYFPYLRGKQFELEALIELPTSVFINTLPILEPINVSQRRLYSRLANQGTPFILVTNPFYPQNSRLTNAAVQSLIDTELLTHPSLNLGFIIDQRFNVSELNSFLTSNPTRNKILIFRYNVLPSDLAAIQASISANPVLYIVFDDRRTNNTTRTAFNSHQGQVLLTDGFQRQDRNFDYPAVSTFDSNYATWQADGWAGIGDYLTIGDYYQDGGGPVFVVCLHITVPTVNGLLMYHFSSTVHSSTGGLSAPKFSEANSILVNSPFTLPFATNGIDIYRDIYNRSHNPQLGVAKKASIMHHIELMSGLI